MDKPLHIRVGQQWQRRDGHIVTIKAKQATGNFYAKCDEGYPWYYYQGGQLNIGGDQYELVKLVQDVPLSEPEPDSEIPASIRAGSEPFYVVVASDDGGGTPIVGEHHLPRQTTLRAALALQRSLGDRYGTTYIAECRIIPELTHDPQ